MTAEPVKSTASISGTARNIVEYYTKDNRALGISLAFGLISLILGTVLGLMNVLLGFIVGLILLVIGLWIPGWRTPHRDTKEVRF